MKNCFIHFSIYSLFLFLLNPMSLQAQNPVFEEVTSVDLIGVSESSVAWGDYNRNGHMDILLTGLDSDENHVGKIYKNDGNGNFDEVSSIELSGASQSSVAWGDYNGNGYLDILLTGRDSDFDTWVSEIYTNNGNGGFEKETSIELTEVLNSSVAWGDYNNNGRLDILLMGTDLDSEFVAKIYENDGDGGFSEVTGIDFTGAHWGEAAWGDYNGNGYLDVLMTGSSSQNSRITKIYENDGNGGFEKVTSISLPGLSSSSVAWGDYNNNGKLDFLLTGWDIAFTPTATVYENDGDGGFEAVSSIELTAVINNGVSSRPIGWGDYNGNGRLDILLSGQDADGLPVVKVYENDGDGNFEEVSGIDITGVNKGSAAWGDYNGNGRLDMLIAGEVALDSHVTNIYENLGEHDPVTMPEPEITEMEVVGSQLELKWDPVIVWNDMRDNSFTYNVHFREYKGDKITSPMADTESGHRFLPAHGNTFLNTFYRINIEPGVYQWGVQAVGTDFRGGPFAEKTFAWNVEPVAEYGSAADITATSATISVDLMPAGLTTEADILFGTNPDDLDRDNLLASGVDHMQQESYSTTITNLDSDTRYYFTVMAENSEGRVYGDTLSFRTSQLNLYEPELVAPVDESTITDDNVVLEWDSVGDAASYKVQVADNRQFQDVITEAGQIEITEFLFRDLEPNTTYHWRVRGETEGETGSWSEGWSFTTGQETAADDRTGIPDEIKVAQNYPNPFNPVTVIYYQLPEAANTSLVVYDITGRKVATLVNETVEAGYHQVQFDASRLSSGTYIYRLEAGDFAETKQMILIK